MYYTSFLLIYTCSQRSLSQVWTSLKPLCRIAKLAIDKCLLLTRQSSNVHLLQVLGFQDDDGEFAGCGHVPEREADVAKLVVLQRAHSVPCINVAVTIQDNTLWHVT